MSSFDVVSLSRLSFSAITSGPSSTVLDRKIPSFLFVVRTGWSVTPPVVEGVSPEEEEEVRREYRIPWVPSRLCVDFYTAILAVPKGESSTESSIEVGMRMKNLGHRYMYKLVTGGGSH